MRTEELSMGNFVYLREPLMENIQLLNKNLEDHTLGLEAEVEQMETETTTAPLLRFMQTASGGVREKLCAHLRLLVAREQGLAKVELRKMNVNFEAAYSEELLSADEDVQEEWGMLQAGLRQLDELEAQQAETLLTLEQAREQARENQSKVDELRGAVEEQAEVLDEYRKESATLETQITAIEQLKTDRTQEADGMRSRLEAADALASAVTSKTKAVAELEEICGIQEGLQLWKLQVPEDGGPLKLELKHADHSTTKVSSEFTLLVTVGLETNRIVAWRFYRFFASW
jgi:chromosome segregation ATPase